jgi:hypothetical protein
MLDQLPFCPQARADARNLSLSLRERCLEGRELVYMGNRHRLVPHRVEPDLEAARTVVTPKSKLTKPIRKPKATWVEPRFLAEVECRDAHRAKDEGYAAGGANRRPTSS